MSRFKVLFLVFILSFSFSMSGFSQYADLVGKWAQISGPWSWRTLGVALDEETCEVLGSIFRYGGRVNFDKILGSFNILRIKNHTSVLILDVKLSESRAKIVILSGMYKGMTGWIPLEWLNQNEERPALAKKSH